MRHAGHISHGIPPRLNVVRSYKNSLGRRIAISTQWQKRIEEAQQKLQEVDEDEAKEILLEIEELRHRMDTIPYFDDVDLRYDHYVKEPIPITKAVMFCVDGETEFLTPTGWKKIEDYAGEQIAQYLPDGNIEFVTPERYVKNDYSEDFIKIKAQGIDQLLTPEHRVVYRNTTGKLKEITAEQLEENHNKTAYGFKGKFISHFTYSGNGIPLSDDEIRFHVAFKADGTYQRSHTNRAQFQFSKIRKITQMINLLDRLGWDYSVTVKEYGTWIYVTTPYHIDKDFGDEWYNFTSSQLFIIAEEVLLWDGYKERGTFSSKQKKDVDYIQFVWACSGYGTNIFEASGVWVVTRCTYSERSLQSKAPKRVTRVKIQDQHSYCFTVPSSMVVFRRNNKIFVSGNCPMDVSASMSKEEKDIAKRLYMFLYLFLESQYKHVDIVWIRHHTAAKRVDEDEFFNSKETGGTIVSSALELAHKIKVNGDELSVGGYPTNQWNIYFAQCTDGDNAYSDRAKCHDLLHQIMKYTQYYAYVQIRSPGEENLWREYLPIAEAYPNFQMRHINAKEEIWKVFSGLFQKQKAVVV